MNLIDGKSILITGGTGSFGKAFIKYVLANFKPKRLVVFSRDELKQFDMANEIDAPNLRYFIGDVRDASRLERALSGIDIVIHAAAMKQVVASEYNPIECIMTNVIGAENVVNACIDCGVKKVIALSTDKAVNPLNLYGASKLCSDKLFVAANNISGADGCRFSVVRYGNVIGSRGSVVPLFRKQMKQGKITITDPRMTRFWLTVGEGVNFVINNLELMRGGEVFVPKIPSMRLTDLASAIAPGCEQEFIGIRPGEKLHETMVPQDEAHQTVEFENYYIIRPNFPLWGEVDALTYGGETGTPVSDGFSYSSDNNTHWVTDEEFSAMASIEGES
ncbi:MAG: UDP-N-acetylglucosamine 4,6-dehydratase (inverting) [Magnetovibrio sp.]|nr:UDP-N-acetylglucosamine 4,6-dehydratase (inverting) [Magnetovibrio sp.]